jgi:tRNA 2-thiocytidine biosynthesis protein TtcA
MIKTDKLRNKLIRQTGKTIGDYNMIEENDRVLVAVSGGKDSWTMLHLLLHFQKVSPVRFDLFPVTVNPGFQEFDCQTITKAYPKIARHLKWQIVDTEINRIIAQKNTPGKHQCAFCARLRRGVLYRLAREKQYNLIALGHHADDAIETVLISGFFEGSMVSLPPIFKPRMMPFKVIRPLIRSWEKEILQYSLCHQFSTVSCGDACCSGGKREYVKDILAQIEKNNPKTKKNFLAALHKIKPERFLDPKWL